MMPKSIDSTRRRNRDEMSMWGHLGNPRSQHSTQQCAKKQHHDYPDSDLSYRVSRGSRSTPSEKRENAKVEAASSIYAHISPNSSSPAHFVASFLSKPWSIPKTMMRLPLCSPPLENDSEFAPPLYTHKRGEAEVPEVPACPPP
jgi:hypothetical protein